MCDTFCPSTNRRPSPRGSRCAIACKNTSQFITPTAHLNQYFPLEPVTQFIKASISNQTNFPSLRHQIDPSSPSQPPRQTADCGTVHRRTSQRNRSKSAAIQPVPEGIYPRYFINLRREHTALDLLPFFVRPSSEKRRRF